MQGGRQAAGRQTDRKAGGKADRQADSKKQTERVTDRQTGRGRDRQADSLTDRWANRQNFLGKNLLKCKRQWAVGIPQFFLNLFTDYSLYKQKFDDYPIVYDETIKELTYPSPSHHLINFFGREGNINLT